MQRCGINSLLDRIRTEKGDTQLIVYFHELTQSNIEKAQKLINDEELQFTSLFILRSKIDEINFYPYLNIKNKIALQIIAEVLSGDSENLTNECLTSDYVHLVKSTLKWILETGYPYDGLSDDYDQLLDTSALLLIKTYRSFRILPVVVKLLCQRYKRGGYIQDLIWAFFESKNPQSLILIAELLRSTNSQESELARKLLGFIPQNRFICEGNGNEHYHYFINWLEDNYLFLYFTGEGFHQTNCPSPYLVSLEAKYLCKSVSTETGSILSTLSERENKLLSNFSKIDKTSQLLLANYSFSLHKKNARAWSTWISFPINEQLKYASSGGAV